MAEAIIWSQESLDDIDRLADYISRDSMYHACRVVDQIFNIGNMLVAQPMMGRVVPELGQSQVREHFIYSYRIIYEIKDKTIHIIAVIHGRRLLESIEERFDK